LSGRCWPSRINSSRGTWRQFNSLNWPELKRLSASFEQHDSP
jgi:hypothetical protein